MKIKYEFVNETVEVDIDETWASVIAELNRLEYNNNQKETRRHTSLNNGYDDGEWLAVEDSSIAKLLEDMDELERLREAMNHLSDKQKKLVNALFVNGVSASEYAKETKVTKGAISQQLKTILKKIKKYF